uniref:Stabilin 2 n=1 Tax=Xiphophorus couchianus TaxID=32473 RepID=A0A3B5MI08_9TELE
VPQRLDVYTACTSCAASVTSSCPRGSSHPPLLCSYLVQIGGRELELPGCHHLCVKNILQPQCCPGHWGPLCLCESSLIPDPDPQSVGQSGLIGHNEGFSGFACQECKNPNAFGKKCDEECDCVNGVCNKGPDGDGQCWCQPPYTGRRCDQGEAASGCRRCSSYSYCKGEAEDANCDCLPGYRKMKDNRCLGEPLLFSLDCDANAQCSKEASNIRCTCRPGYDGDGKICIPKNPCLVNNGGCPANSTVCVFKGPDKSSCECMLGMSPLGGSAEHGCQLVSACTAVTCDPTATCQTELDGKPRCLCEPGLLGDGHRCYGNLMARLMELDQRGNQRENLTGAVNCGSPPPLRGPGPLTLFVPTNDAVDRARDGTHLLLFQAKQKLQELLRHHVFSQLTVDDLVALPQVRTMANQLVTVSASDTGEVLLGEKGVRLAGSNIMASNGVIHMIDGLLYPPSILPILPHRCDVTKSKITLVRRHETW